MATRLFLVCGIATLVWLMGLPGIYGLFEDQVGMYDWHQQYIGRVKLAEFQTQTQRKRVFVATELNVLAALNLRTGQIAWRRVLGDNDAIDAMKIFGKYVVTLSGGGRLLRGWSVADGVLQWDATVLPLPPPLDLSLDGVGDFHIVPTGTENSATFDVVLLSGGRVYRISGTTGELLWEGQVLATKLHVTENAIYAVGFTNPTGSTALGVAITEIDLTTGYLSEPITALAPTALSASRLIITSGFLIVLDHSGRKVFIGKIDSHNLEVVETDINDLLSKGSETAGAILLPAKVEGAFGLAVSSSLLVVGVGKEGQLKRLMEVGRPGALSDRLPLEDGGRSVLGVVHHTGQEEGREVTLKVMTADGEEEDGSQETVVLKPGRGNVERVYINSYPRKKGDSIGYRFLIVTEDDALALLQQGEVVWEREEALASVVDVKMVDLPSGVKGKGDHPGDHSLQEWFKDHWLRAKATVMMATPEEREMVQKMRVNNVAKNSPVRDHNRFRKLIVVLTRPGKVLALHTGDGRIIWSVLLKGLRTDVEPVPLKLMVSQDPHRLLGDQIPEVIVLGKRTDGKDDQGILVYVNGHTGDILRTANLNFAVSLSIQLPFLDNSGRRLLMLVDNATPPRAHIFPATEESKDLFERRSAHVFFYIVDKAEGEVRGYGITGVASGQSEVEGHTYETVELWKIVFPKELENIATTATIRADEGVHTQTRALGNRGVQYKYLNKNLLFVATVAPLKDPTLGPITPEESWLVAYIIDTVTGRVLHRLIHNNMQGPVYAVMAENWVVYHYFNLRSHRYEMSVLEFYDNSDRGNVGEIAKYALGLGGGNFTAPLSSWALPPLNFQTQSYFFSNSLKALTVTSTSSGITNRQLLLGTLSDQVLAMDKRFLDPRRTLTPTQQDREEGLPPYTDTLPISSQAYLTHGLQVEGLRGIVSEPSRLESTTLVFVFGVDLFYIRTAPSKMYDTLSEDFSYVLLLVTIVALLVAILVTWMLAERRDLEMRWR